MSDTLLAAIVGAITGVITGTIASIFAPWANWGVEKRRKRFDHRKELVVQWRKMVKEIINRHQIDRTPLIDLLQLDESWYSLKPPLGPVMLNFIGVDAKNPYSGNIAKHSISLQKLEQQHPKWELDSTFMSIHILNRLVDEIGEIEKKWGLV